MDFSTISLFGVMKGKLNYLSARQAVLAQNVANADTPGYQAMDMPEPDFKRMLAGNTATGRQSSLPMTLTNQKHMPGQPSGMGSGGAVKRATTQELNPNGNNVVIEEEMSKVAANQAEYQKALNLYGKMITMFKTAIGNPNAGG